MTRDEKLKHIKERPELHQHDFGELQRCCFVDGALDLSVMEAHSEYVNMGSNGGTRCDVRRGPCACGAWH
jgi:hypothetical protein